MSILIKGMDMPKESPSLTLHIWADGTVEVANERIFKGQAIQIPTPHGRLIDASELIKSYMRGTKTGIDDFYDTIDIIDNAPTILEAEGRTYTIQADSETVSYKNGENQF